MPFLNIMNEWYLKDQSKKVAAAYQLRGKSGLPTNNNCLYGYRKDPDVKHHWLVDEEAAAIVRRIYQMACEGHGPSEIARILTKEKVDNPGYYYTKHACGMRSDYTKEAHAHDWNSLTISRILTH
ncbi:MAG: recombinase family protein [Christensenellales bacterium]